MVCYSEFFLYLWHEKLEYFETIKHLVIAVCNVLSGLRDVRQGRTKEGLIDSAWRVGSMCRAQGMRLEWRYFKQREVLVQSLEDGSEISQWNAWSVRCKVLRKGWG